MGKALCALKSSGRQAPTKELSNKMQSLSVLSTSPIFKQRSRKLKRTSGQVVKVSICTDD